MRHGDRQPLKAGYYWELSTGNIIFIPHRLMGDRRKRYLRIPAPLVVVLGPVLGLLYIVWLPLVGVVTLTGLGFQRLGQAFRAGGKALFLIATTRKEHDKRP
ncbi:MAG: hypothetical protein Q7T04_00315 [Dehalococcoidia bacterium]|nr:hypothetical protein [Dehalococcoidia bacterium]